MFYSLNLTNKWNIPQNHQTDAFVTLCYKCGLPELTNVLYHMMKQRSQKAKEAHAKASAEGSASGGHGYGCGCGRGGKGVHGGDRTNTWGKWQLNDAPMDPKTNKTSAGGIEKRNGTWMMNCKSCGWNNTHTFGYHGKWTHNQSAFKLSVTHVFWSKLGSAPSAEKGPPPAPSTATSGVSKGQLSGLVSQYKTETKDGMFASFLNEFEGLIN